MAPPNIRVPGRSIPSGYIVGRTDPGVGDQQLISIADIAAQMISLGVVASPGAPSSLAAIANNRFLANRSGGTAAPVATPFTDIDTVGTLTTGTWSAGTVGSSTNSNGSIPASTTTAGWRITSNYSNTGSVDLWNTVNGSTGGFAFWQKTGASSAVNISNAYSDGATFMEFDFLANASGTIGGYFYVDATGFYVGENSGVPDFFLQVSNGGSLNVQFNGATRNGFNTNGLFLNGATSGTLTIKPPAVAGTNSITLPAGTTDFSATGGSGRHLRQLSAGAAITVEPPEYPIAFSAPQTVAYNASQVLGAHRMACATTIPANFASYLGLSTTAGGAANATSDWVLSVEKAASATPTTFNQVGTITIGSGGAVSTALATASGAAQNFAAGDILRIVAPNPADATFVGFMGTLILQRQ